MSKSANIGANFSIEFHFVSIFYPRCQNQMISIAPILFQRVRYTIILP